MIDRFIAALVNAGVDVTAEDVADVLWLAAKMKLAPKQRATPGNGATPPPPPRRTEIGARPEMPRLAPGLGAGAVSLVLPPPAPTTVADASGRSSVPLRAPSAAALPDALAIGRALRPLRRRVPSRTRVELDEGASVEQIAETRTASPVVRRAPARWLDLALVIDASASMVLWRRTVAELGRLLRFHGAFRDVRTFRLLTDAGAVLTPEAFPTSRGASLVQRRAHELLDPAGRRLVLVVSDCVSPGWRSGAVAAMLGDLARSGPVALLQMLPRSLWSRTALRVAPRVHLEARSAAAPNARLSVSYLRTPRGKPDDLPPPLPVMTLDAASIGAWTRLVAGGPGAVPGVVLLGAPASRARRKATEDIAAEERLDRFLAMASPAACTLARFLGAAPVSLAVMRLVQWAMVPGAGHAAIAEVFLSGLLRKIPDQAAEIDQEEVQYDFLPGVRDRLLDLLPGGDALRVLRRVADEIAARAGRSDGFAALLDDANADVERLPAERRPFATIAASVLARLGIAPRRRDTPPRRDPAPATEVWVSACAIIEVKGRPRCMGYLVSPETVATCAHAFGSDPLLIDDDGHVRVTLGGVDYNAHVEAIDHAGDCALLRLETRVPPEILPLRGSLEVEIGARWETASSSDVDPSTRLHQHAGTFEIAPIPLMVGPPMLLQPDNDGRIHGIQPGAPVIVDGRFVGHFTSRAAKASHYNAQPALHVLDLLDRALGRDEGFVPWIIALNAAPTSRGFALIALQQIQKLARNDGMKLTVRAPQRNHLLFRSSLLGYHAVIGARRRGELEKMGDIGIAWIAVDPRSLEGAATGQWPRLPEQNGRILRGRLTRHNDSRYRASLVVTTMAGAAPLEGDVVFHLHPTFERTERRIPVQDGTARLTLIIWGWFVVGVTCDGGRTHLELDLGDLPLPPEISSPTHSRPALVEGSPRHETGEPSIAPALKPSAAERWQRAPGGAMMSGEPLYVSRSIDQDLLAAARRPGETIVLRGARRTGKSSLLRRYCAERSAAGGRVVAIDLMTFPEQDLWTYGAFLTAFAAVLRDELHLIEEAPTIRDTADMIGFVERALSAVLAPVTLAIDETERIFERSYRDDFFAMVRSWDGERIRSRAWVDLDIALVVLSGHALLLDQGSSPFKVGTSLDVDSFTLEECATLGASYAVKLSHSDIDEIFGLLGGQPYLTHLAYHQLFVNELPLPELLRTASNIDGPFGDHLRTLMARLTTNPAHLHSFRELIATGRLSEPSWSFMAELMNDGLIVPADDGQYRPANKLYAEFFGK